VDAASGKEIKELQSYRLEFESEMHRSQLFALGGSNLSSLSICVLHSAVAVRQGWSADQDTAQSSAEGTPGDSLLLYSQGRNPLLPLSYRGSWELAHLLLGSSDQDVLLTSSLV
jgi:hypothetical protein